MTSIEKEKPFQLGASYTIGSYILPGEKIDDIHEKVNRKIKLTIVPCDQIIKGVKEKKLDLGFIESPIFDDTLSYVDWMDDELVVCSKKQLPSSLKEEDLHNCRIVCREKGTLNREFIENFLASQGLSCYDFASISEVDSPIAIIQSIKWSKPHAPITAVAIVSKIAIEYELKYKDLYESSINNTPIVRKFYIIYRKDSNYLDIIDKIV